MSRNRWTLKLWTAVAAVAMLAGLSVLMSGQEKSEEEQPRVPVIEDWSTRHLVFSNPGTYAQALDSRQEDWWERIVKNPRYTFQQMKRSSSASPEADSTTTAWPYGIFKRPGPKPPPWPPAPTPVVSPLKRDWSMSLGSSGTGGTDNFPAKFTFSPTDAPSCASDPSPDYVVYNSSLSNVTHGTGSGSFSTAPAAGATVTVNGQAFTAATPATGKITIGSSYCIAPGQGVSINGVNITTSATGAHATVTVSSDPDGGGTGVESLTIPGGGTTYTLESSCAAGAGSPSNCVVDGGTGTAGHTATVENLTAAINNNPNQCSGAPTACFSNVSGPNSVVYASNAGSNVLTVTQLCAGSAPTFTQPTAATVSGTTTAPSISSVTAGTTGSAGTGVFALPATASNTTVASNMATAIGTESSTDLATASAASGVVTVSAYNPGTAGEVSVAIYTNPTVEFVGPTGITLSNLSGGASGTLTGDTGGSNGNTPPYFAWWGSGANLSTTNIAANLASAIQSYATTVGVSASNNGSATVTITALAGGLPGNGIAYSAESTPLASNFSWTGSSTSGGASTLTQASIVAYDNLYATTCTTGSVPSVYWAYDTGGTVTTSPIISYHGDQVAYVENVGTKASLVLLRWLPSTTATVGGPTLPTYQPAASYNGCTAPCYTVLPLGAADTNSSPFYDYWDDTMYVGDDSGRLHKFTTVLQGTPTEVTTNYPVQVSTYALNSPVYDVGSTDVFLTDADAVLWQVTTGATPATSSENLPNTGGNYASDGPLVDSSARKVYVFTSYDGTAEAVQEYPIPLAAANVTATFGTGGSTANPAYAGTFDNAYFNSDNGSPATPTGSLYVCGNNSTGYPTLYQLTISGGTLSTTVRTQATLTSASTTCSPVSEVYNSGITPGIDFIFLGVAASGVETQCGGIGCLTNFVVSNWQGNTAYTLGQGIIVPGTSANAPGTVQKVTATAGTGKTGASAPTFSATIGSSVTDTNSTGNSVTWTCEGPYVVTAFQTSHTYASNAIIVDSNGNIERVTAGGGGSSGTANPPTGGWKTVGLTTVSGSITFTNQGPGPIALTETGGASGIIIDNISTSTGASQLYFSTLSNNTCSNGTGGCAVQASQAAP